jgi:uncharacterized membrane protein YsdA (DUF1294 family)
MPSADTLYAFAEYAIVINLVGFVAFAWDKFCARNGMWRISERTLLTLVVLGGTVGAVIGQQVLRHKTKKEPFRTYLLALVVIQTIGLVALCFPQVQSAIWGR